MPARVAGALFLLAGLLLAGCAGLGTPAAEPGSAGTEGPSAPAPAPRPAAPQAAPALPGPPLASDLTHVANLPDLSAGDLAFHGDWLYTASPAGTFVVNIADPANPTLESAIDCRGRDINVVEHGGRIILVISSQADDTDLAGTDGCAGAHESGGLRLVDVTDPSSPIVGPQVPLVYGSHTNTPYGTTGLVYNSAYTLYFNNPVDPFAPPLLDRVDIVDLANFTDAHVAGTFEFPPAETERGCHDIFAEPKRDRAFCAAGSETMLWDTTDPLHPEVVWTLRNPLITYHHSAVTARHGTLLVLGDEWAAALPPGGCAHQGHGPQGAAWFYDIAGAEPALLGWWAPPSDSTGVCTVHEFNVVPGRDLLVGSLWTGGVFLVDFSDPAAPVTLDVARLPGADTWAAYAHGSHAFAGDRSRGIDVFRLD